MGVNSLPKTVTWQRLGCDLLHDSVVAAIWTKAVCTQVQHADHYQANQYKQYNVDNSDVCCAGFFVYKLVRSLRDKALAREEKKKLKQQRREKEMTKKTKKKWCTVYRHWTSHVVTFLWNTCTCTIYLLTDWLTGDVISWIWLSVVIRQECSCFVAAFYFLLWRPFTFAEVKQVQCILLEVIGLLKITHCSWTVLVAYKHWVWYQTSLCWASMPWLSTWWYPHLHTR